MTHGQFSRVPANRTLVRIVGMSRSGNHAIINWILGQLPGRWCFLNCAEPGSDPFRTARMTDDGRCHLSNDPRIDTAAGRTGALSVDTLLVSHEDTFLKPVFGAEGTARQLDPLGRFECRIDMLILRDPYNLFASRRRFGHRTISDHVMVRIWKQHARAMLGDTRVVAGPVLGVSYNAWARDRRYRSAVAGKLGLDFTDAGFHQVGRCGGGSSFDGYRFQGRADRMNLFERWRHYWGERHFRELFDAEIQSLSGRIFGLPHQGLARRHLALDAELSSAEG